MIIRRYPGLEELFKRFASPPIRNAGTLVGNIANGSPIGDSMPVLMALGTELVLRSAEGVRTLPLEDYYLDYGVTARCDGEFIERVRVPLPPDGTLVRSYKISKRFDQDISAVCTAYRLRLDGDKVAEFRMACGGLASTIKRAAMKQGMHTLREDGARKILDGMTSIEEVCRVTQEDTQFDEVVT